MIGQLYHLGRARPPSARRRLLERFDLTDAADRLVKTYSGGMRRRLDLAASLVAARRCCSSTSRPPGSTRARRHELWEVIASSSTPARRPAHHPVPRRGRPAGRPHRRHRPRARHRRGTPAELKAGVGGEQLEVCASDDRAAAAAARLRSAPRRDAEARALDVVRAGHRRPTPDRRGARARRRRCPRTSACAGRHSTTSSSRSPATPPTAEEAA